VSGGARAEEARGVGKFGGREAPDTWAWLESEEADGWARVAFMVMGDVGRFAGRACLTERIS
jgi:hypothetical protein